MNHQRRVEVYATSKGWHQRSRRQRDRLVNECLVDIIVVNQVVITGTRVVDMGENFPDIKKCPTLGNGQRCTRKSVCDGTNNLRVTSMATMNSVHYTNTTIRGHCTAAVYLRR